jgi:hypothetical protein
MPPVSAFVECVAPRLNLAGRRAQQRLIRYRHFLLHLSLRLRNRRRNCNQKLPVRCTRRAPLPRPARLTPLAQLVP